MKLIRKLMPVNVYDIAKTQSYLSDMALKGYYIKKLDGFAYFERQEPEETTYRLEPLMKNEKQPDDEKLAHYEDYGWEYVCTISTAFHVYKTNRKDFIEIHTDPITQSYAFEHLNKKLKSSYIITVLILPLATFMILNSVFLHNHPVLFAVQYGNIVYKIMVSLLAFFTVKRVINNRKKIKLLLNRLKSGSEMHQESAYKPDYSPYVFNILISVFSILTIGVSLFMLNTDWEKNLSEYKSNIPTIQLANIETAPDFELENEGYHSNYISYDWTELAPEIYEINERGLVNGQMWEDQSGEYSPSLRTEYYRIRFGFLTEAFLNDLIDNEMEFFRYSPILYQELLDTDFDEAVLIQVSETQMFFGKLDQSIIYIRYHGYEDLYAHIDQIFNNVKSFQ